MALENFLEPLLRPLSLRTKRKQRYRPKPDNDAEGNLVKRFGNISVVTWTRCSIDAYRDPPWSWVSANGSVGTMNLSASTEEINE